MNKDSPKQKGDVRHPLHKMRFIKNLLYSKKELNSKPTSDATTTDFRNDTDRMAQRPPMPVPRPSTSKGQEDAVYIEMTEVPPVLPPAPPPSRNGSFRESPMTTPISSDGVPVQTLRQ